MKETRFFYVPDASETGMLPDEEAIHALRVLRLKTGDEVFLIDGKGTFYRAVITLTDTRHCWYEMRESMPQERTWRGRIHLAIAPTKMMDRMEWLVEKATEIGMDAFTFLDCQFSERKALRLDRLDKIVIAAVKQSRKAWKPAVHPLVPFNEFMATPRAGRLYIAHCYPEIERSDLFNELTAHNDDEDITILIGPEGDFSVEEVKIAAAHGYTSISLGKSRLRTETAGLFAVAMANLARRI
ncbi:MAG: 16S rRNA (uracil(1498)-N(3))-methyltransferase [Prevotella sp.]|nr:16S rRNA (uracil(1498)-N(3))-methyltransferase [Prevotella sp.]MDY4040246.1 RsmE family RNA methyltransferase [Prevotella sp.]